MRAKKVMAFIMAGTMLMSMAACSNNTTVNEGTEVNVSSSPTTASGDAYNQTSSGGDATTTPAETTPAETTVPKTEGELLAEKYTGFIETPMDLGGRTIHVVSTSAKRFMYNTDADGNPDPDNTPNDKIEVIKAIEEIERDYNCKIEFEQLKGKNLVSALITAQSAGDTYCDILEFGCSDTYLEQIYAAQLCMDLNDERIADIIKLEENPWLPASDFGLWAGAQYGVHFKTYNSNDHLRSVILVNKDLAKQYGVDNIYDLYYNKEWTFDKFSEICASIAAQSDGKVYPFIYGKESLYIPVLIYGNGGSTAAYEDGKYTYTALTDNTLEALNYAVDWQNKGYCHPLSESGQDEQTFANGEAVFYFCLYAGLTKYTEGTIENNYEIGLLPGPLGPSGDGEYNGVTYTEMLFNVMDNVEKPEEVAAVLVAIANRTGMHDMIETELLNTLQDEESADVLQTMYDNMKCDFSRSISTTRSLFVKANKSILKGEKTPKEAYEEIASQVQTYFDEYNSTGKITKIEE